MTDTLRTILLTGLGALDLTQERVRTALHDLVQRGALTEREARDLGRAYLDRLGRSKRAWTREAQDTVQRALRDLNIATHDEMDALGRRVEVLEQQAGLEPGPSLEGRPDPEC